MDPARDVWSQGPTSRDSWVALARALVAPALQFQSPARSEIQLPGRESWHGARADGLEAFARVFLLEALAGCQEAQVAPTTQVLLDGIAAGVGGGAHAWIRGSENSHALVEAPSLCVGLWVGGHRLWRTLSLSVQRALATWLADCASQFEGRSNNWTLFPFVISRFLDSVDHPHPRRAEIEDTTLRLLDALYRGDGWYSDGGLATFDYYNAFAFHYYPGIVGYLSGDEDLRQRSTSRLARFLPDLVSLIASDGAPVYFGRSMTYRFGIAAPLSVAPLLGVADPAPATFRELTQRMVEFFVAVGGITIGAALVPGWARSDDDLVQDYSGPGAAYWAAHAFSNLLLAPEHAYWGPAVATALPSNTVHRLERPNFLLASAPDRSIIRLTNHGSFDVNITTVKRRGDDPFYGRLGYSTATLPLARGEADSSFTVHDRGRRYRRGRIAGRGGGVDWAASDGWLRDVESAGESRVPAGFLTLTTSSWDVHLMALPRWARVRRASVSFRGWAVDAPPDSAGGTTDGAAVVLSARLDTTVRGLLGFTDAEVVSGVRPRGGYLLGEVAGHARDGLYAVATSLGPVGSSPPPPTIVPAGRNRWVITVPEQGQRVVRRRRTRLELTGVGGGDA